jgi:predicted dithiol-disulfide oxidoreductase (DUF899 family)
MIDGNSLTPAAELAARSQVRYPNESAEYRRARQALLVEEIELRRHIERVAEQRRALPPGGEVLETYRFQGESGPTTLADLFGDKQTLLVYTFMFGPQRARPCPMCTSLLGAWNGEARDLEQRVALAVVARSPIERLSAFKKERGWHNLKLYSDSSGEYCRDYHAVSPDGGDTANLDVWRNGPRVLRPWPGSARCAGPHATVDTVGLHSGGTRDRLVPEARVRALKTGAQNKTAGSHFLAAGPPCINSSAV